MQTKRLSLLGGVILFGSIFSTQAQTNFFHFRTPHPLVCRVEENVSAARSAKPAWLKVFVGSSTNEMERGHRIVVQLKPDVDLEKVIADRPLTLSRTVAPNIFILQSPDAWTALREAEALANLPDVLTSYPVMRRMAELQSAFSSFPNDRWFFTQWNLGARNSDGSVAGPNLNVRGAWPVTRGEGVTIAVADVGVELNHLELSQRAAGAPHFNFTTQTTNGLPALISSAWAHGTEVSGLAVAEANNGKGMVGVAPKANLASWVVFTSPNQFLASDEQLMDMYQYASNTVAIQNHSWTITGARLDGPSLLEQIGISNALTHGRFGRGSIMVRPAGNNRKLGANANDDGYASDPRVVAVAAARRDGRNSADSEPGACILVAAPSGDANSGFNGLFTTDLLGLNGVNQAGYCPPSDPDCPNKDLSDYVFDSLGFAGTSASVPQIAGAAALILSANTNLTYRDVQQILVSSARHFDFADPDLTTNGAGFRVSHNLGFGVPDAGHAVRLARNWPNRPAKKTFSLTKRSSTPIPDGGLRVLISGDDIPMNLLSIAAAPSEGQHADSPTSVLPLVNVGVVTNAITVDLTNKAALIQHPVGGDYATEITRAAQAGAAFAILFAPSDASVPSAMLGTDYVPIPAVIIGQTKGVALQNYLQTNTANAQIQLDSANYSFNFSQTLICEHVGVRVSLNHSFRADLRVTLISPQGTRSVMQRVNGDTSAAPTDWTFWSTHHFFESSAGTWTVSVTDEFPGATGSVESIGLIINGVAITDSDHDGLDDNWETSNFGSLATNSKDDFDKDGNNNAREQILGTNPNAIDASFQLDFSRLDSTLGRLSWPGSESFDYEVRSGTHVADMIAVTNVVGRFPETEWITTFPNSGAKFFQVRAVPKP